MKTAIATAPKRTGRLAPLALLALAVSLGGCAGSLLSDGALREEPLRELQDKTARAGGLAFTGSVTPRVIDRARVPAVLRVAIERDFPPGGLAAYQDALTAIGLWPADRDLVSEYTAVAHDEIVGFYIFKERALYVVRDPIVPLSLRVASFLLRRDFAREIALAHELVHALQHQHYPDLWDRTDFLIAHDDFANASQAAFEGDATRYGLAALEVPDPDPTKFREALERDASERADGALAAAPALIRLGLVFPYARGYALSVAEGRALLDEPPASTEQVMHPTQRDAAFQAIDLAAARSDIPAGCGFVHENSVGELGLSILFRDLSPPGNERVWEGWDGDRYLVARCAGQREFVWLTFWDSEADAQEFESAYRAVAAAAGQRSQLAGAPTLTRTYTKVVIASPGLANVSATLAARARRLRVSRIDQYLAHFGERPRRRVNGAIEIRQGSD